VAVAVTSHACRLLRIAARLLRPPYVARAGQRLVELAFEHGLQEFSGSIAKPNFDGVKPVVEKLLRRIAFGLRQAGRRAMAPHGVISAGASTPESLVGPS
jgi:hypothetical protein